MLCLGQPSVKLIYRSLATFTPTNLIIESCWTWHFKDIGCWLLHKWKAVEWKFWLIPLEAEAKKKFSSDLFSCLEMDVGPSNFGFLFPCSNSLNLCIPHYLACYFSNITSWELGFFSCFWKVFPKLFLEKEAKIKFGSLMKWFCSFSVFYRGHSTQFLTIW